MADHGRITFEYSKNNGVRAIGSGVGEFKTKWSSASNTSIHAYTNPPSITSIALATGASRISNIRDAERFDFSSNHVSPRLREVVILRSASGRYAAVQILAVTARSHGPARDEVTIRYVILPEGVSDFSSWRGLEVVDNSFERHVLLIGAGFSRNWGGLLAGEVQTRIFNHTAVQARPRLREMVLQTPFEDALEMTREGTWEREDQEAIEAAIGAAFENMDTHFRNPNPPVLSSTINDFISRFCPGGVGIGTGYVFSLNQDLLLERIYGNIVDRQHLVVPGVTWIEQTPPWPAGAQNIPNATPKNESELEDVQLIGNFNYIKLHGSINWSGGPEAPGMVMGRRKAAMIAEHPLLSWNYNIFEAVLAAENTKVMVIGYSWYDDHINSVIADAIRDHGLRVYSWDILGAQDLIAPRHRGREILAGVRGSWTRSIAEVMPPDAEYPRTPEYDNIVETFFSDNC